MTEDTTREMNGVHRRQKRRTIVVSVVAAVALVAIGYGIATATVRADQAETEAALSAANAQLIAEQITAACEEQGEVADQLGDLCKQAEQVAQDPAEPVAIPPTDEQLRPLVQQYVQEWLAQNRPRAGRDGDTPTVAELTDLIALELSRNPPEDGQDGRTPTAAEIRPIVAEEVAAYLLAFPPPSGPPGPAGQDGADSEVPGPVGPSGPPGSPGPTCPDGWHPEERQVGLPPETWIVCVQDPEG